MAKSETRQVLDPNYVNCLLFPLQDVPIPWKAIFSSLPVFAILVAQFTQTWGVYTMIAELPLYFNQRLHLDLKQVTLATRHF